MKRFEIAERIQYAVNKTFPEEMKDDKWHELKMWIKSDKEGEMTVDNVSLKSKIDK